MIIIIISHKPNVVKICDRVMVLKGKKLIFNLNLKHHLYIIPVFPFNI